MWSLLLWLMCSAGHADVRVVLADEATCRAMAADVAATVQKLAGDPVVWKCVPADQAPSRDETCHESDR